MAKLRCQARGMSSTIEQQGNHLTPINTKKKGDIDGTISSIKTRNYWNYVDSLDMVDVPGPFVDLRETQRHKNKVQKLTDKTH